MTKIPCYTPVTEEEQKTQRLTEESLRSRLTFDQVDAVDRHEAPTLNCAACKGQTFVITYRSARLNCPGWKCVDCGSDKDAGESRRNYWLNSAVRVHVLGVSPIPEMVPIPDPELSEGPEIPDKPVRRMFTGRPAVPSGAAAMVKGDRIE